MLNIKSITISTLFCLSVLTSNIANAATIVQFSVNGEITRATANNFFDLAVGDIITLTGEFDDSIIGPGDTLIDFSLSYNNFTLNFGNTVYTDDDDLNNLAAMYILDGAFDGLDYITSDNKFNSTGYVGYIDPVTGEVYEDFIAHNNTIGGYWLVDSFEMTPVPVPAAVWLFGSGLVFLAGIARRKQKA